MASSDPTALALAALTALGSDIVAMRGRASQVLADTTIEPIEPIPARRRKSSRSKCARSRRSRSSRSCSASMRTSRSRTLSSCSSSTKSISKSSRSKKKKKKEKSPASKATGSKVSSIWSESTTASRRRTTVLMTVAPQPKPEKYVPPPKGTFRSSYTRHLRSEVIGALAADIEGLTIPEWVPLIADRSEEQSSTSSSPLPTKATPSQKQQVALRHSQPSNSNALTTTTTTATPAAAVVSRQRLLLENLPTLALAEFDFFSASRARSSDAKETSAVWARSPAAPAPPRVRRWLKHARQPPSPVGALEEIDEEVSVKSENSGSGRDSLNLEEGRPAPD